MNAEYTQKAMRGKETQKELSVGEKELPPYRLYQAAARLGIDERSIIAAVKKGRLAGSRLNRLWLINREQVDRLARGEPTEPRVLIKACAEPDMERSEI